MTAELPPPARLTPKGLWSRICWLFLAGGLVAAMDLLWCWACFSDAEGPGNGMALMIWLVIQAGLVLTASLLVLLGLIVTKEHPRWLGCMLLTAAWMPVYFWWRSGHLPFFDH